MFDARSSGEFHPDVPKKAMTHFLFMFNNQTKMYLIHVILAFSNNPFIHQSRQWKCPDFDEFFVTDYG